VSGRAKFSGASRGPLSARAIRPESANDRRYLRIEPGTYAVQTLPGLEDIALEEVVERIPGARVMARRVVPGRSGIGIFRVSSTRELAALRTAEDLFAVVGARTGLRRGRLALDDVRRAVREIPTIDWALETRVALTPGSRAGRRLRFRVIARLTGEHEFRRVDLKRAAELAFCERRDHAWRLDEERADLELWATVLDEELIIAVRLTDSGMRHRGYREVERPAALRPSVAAAMVFMSGPQAEDVLLDPFCGSGTILMERALAGRYRLLIGSDRDQGAIEAARINIGPRFKPIELHRWDVTAGLPLAEHSVDAIVANLPWGMRVGSHRENRRLYPIALAELMRVLKPSGRMVLLTGEMRLMSEIISKRMIEEPARLVPVSILGAAAAIYVIRNGSSTGHP
jgi:tRNA (guanine6-N2)-methyltransferase